MTDFVKSVEWFELTLSSVANSISNVVTKGQILTNCVPFVSYSIESANYNYIYNMIDVYVDVPTNTINIKRHSSGSTLIASIYLVEFDPEQVRVQQLSFDYSTATSTTTVSTVNMSKTGLVFYQAVTASSNNWYYAGARAYFSNSTTITHQRSPANRVYGHYFLFEDLGNNFKVSHYQNSCGGSTDFTTSEIVDLKNSFMLGSMYTNYDYNYATYLCGLRCLDTSGANSYGTQTYNGTGTKYISVSIITFLDGSKIRCYSRELRGYIWASGTANFREHPSFIIPNLDYCMVFGFTSAGPVSVNYTDTYPAPGFIRYKLADDYQVTINHYPDTNYGVYYNYQVVDWKGFDVVKSPVVEPLQNSCVKSIEYMDITTLDTKCYNMYKLTKGQVAANCVPFATVMCVNDAAYAHYCDISITEPGVVEIYNFSQSSMNISLYIVEFKSEHVKVQQVRLCGTSGTASKTIDPVDLSKTFVTSYYTRNNRSTNMIYVTTRTRLSDSTTVELVCYYGTRLQATSYIVESLDDSFSVVSFLNGMGSLDHSSCELHKSFVVSSYYWDYDHNYASMQGVRLLRRGSMTIDFANYSNTGTKYISTFIVQFGNQFGRNRVYTQHYYMGLNNVVSTSKTINYWQDSSSMVCGTMHGGTTIVNYNGTLTRLITAKFYPTTNNTKIEMNVGQVQNIDTSCGMQVIDWVGQLQEYTRRSEVYCGDKKLIISVEDFYGAMDGSGQNFRTHRLTKGQVGDNCITFITFYSDQNNVWLHTVDCWVSNDNIAVVQNAYDAGFYINYHLQVVELNPSKVKVQKGSYKYTGTASTAVIQEVNLAKTFLNFHHNAISSNNNSIYARIRGMFLNSTTLEFRANGGYRNNGHFEVVEALDDSFTVIHKQSTSSTTTITEGLIISDRSLILMSDYFSLDYHYANRNGHQVYLNKYSNTVQVDRYDGSGTRYMNFEIITFNKLLDIKIYEYNFYFSSGTSFSKETYLSTDSTKIIVPQFLNYLDVNYSGTASYYHLFKHEFLGSVLKSYCNSNVANVTTVRGFVYTIESPSAPTHYFKGDVKVEYKPKQRIVRIYDKITGELIDSKTSDGSMGTIEMGTTSSGLHYAVSLDDDALDDYNDLVYGNLRPGVIG